MRGLVNDIVRFLIAHVIRLSGVVLASRQQMRMISFIANQRRLKRRYRLQPDTPVMTYGPRVVESIRNAAARLGRGASFAITSGSTGEPKKILYTRQRLRVLKFAFSDMFARACRAYRLPRTTLFVFSSFQRDASLTSMLLDEHKLPPYLATLQAPYRLPQHPAIRALASEYGAASVRLWLLTLSNPGVLYATNPSTISTFLDELKNDWSKCVQLAKNWCNDPQRFDRAIHSIAHRIESRGSGQRLQTVASSTRPLSVSEFAPAVRACICWTGGYVKPFLDRLTAHLPPPRYQLIPMYSMSTETIETETVFRGGKAHFLPLADGVVYEFIESGKDDRSENLLTPDQLEPGGTYAMVVSDRYGLRRYQTEDLFACRRMVHKLPDLVFLRRRALEYSFIGEKVTTEQLTTVFDHLRMHYVANGFLTCVPSLLPRPHYKLIVTGEHITQPNLIANQCDELLSALNCEYKNKRTGGILGPISLVQISAAEFAERFASSWETQFKFLPLYRRTWESMSSFEHSELTPVS